MQVQTMSSPAQLAPGTIVLLEDGTLGGVVQNGSRPPYQAKVRTVDGTERILAGYETVAVLLYLSDTIQWVLRDLSCIGCDKPLADGEREYCGDCTKNQQMKEGE